MNEHTPTPWNIGIKDGKGYRHITTRNDCCIAMVTGGDPMIGHWNRRVDANAEYIVRAVNSHADLLEACKNLLDYFWDMPSWEYARSRGLQMLSEADGERVKEQARTAITKAEGRSTPA